MSIFRTDDPVADFHRHDAMQEKEAEKFPTCCECDHTIYEEFIYEYNDEPICDECMRDNHRRSRESFI